VTVWIADYRIESTLILPPSQPEIQVSLPDCKISIQNAKNGDLPNEALAAQILLDAPTIAAAEQVADRRMREILDVLSYVTSNTFKISRQRFLMDWTPGIEIRDQYAYGHDSAPERWPELAAEYLETVNVIEGLEGQQLTKLRTPLRWFAAGIRAGIPEDQFQYFWFVLELIAELGNDRRKVTDKCQRCRGDLFCPTCNAISEHRPFPKQAIEGLFTQLDVSADMQRDLFKIRNGIMHGRTRAEIEEDIRTDTPDFEISEAVDFIWQTAIASILNALQVPGSHASQITFGSPDSIVRRSIKAKFHLKIGMHGDSKEPRLENVVVPSVETIRTNAQGEPINPLTGERR
jgi:hypothetical protein